MRERIRAELWRDFDALTDATEAADTAFARLTLDRLLASDFLDTFARRAELVWLHFEDDHGRGAAYELMVEGAALALRRLLLAAMSARRDQASGAATKPREVDGSEARIRRRVRAFLDSKAPTFTGRCRAAGKALGIDFTLVRDDVKLAVRRGILLPDILPQRTRK
jgi:hypothetical protein